MSVPRRRPGDPVVLREIWDGRVWAARPMTVVADRADLVAVFMAVGTPWKRPVAPEGGVLRMPWRDWRLADDVWERTHFLHLVTPGAAHAVMAAFAADDFAFRGWYVNLQEPLRRSDVGWDYMDQMLDVVVDAGGRWELKDEDELREEVERGLMSPSQADEVRGEAMEVVRRLEAGEPPFADGWDRWRPDPAWPLPGFPPGWDVVD